MIYLQSDCLPEERVILTFCEMNMQTLEEINIWDFQSAGLAGGINGSWNEISIRQPCSSIMLVSSSQA